MSYDASGSVADAITFSKWKGRNYVRRHAVPANPKSASQISTRAMMRFLTKVWASQGATYQGTFAAGAASLNVSPFNYFIKYNMDRWTQFQDPARTLSVVALTNPVLGALTLTGGVGQYSLSQVITTVNDYFGLLICHSLTTGFTPGKTNVQYVAIASASPTTAIITGLAAGTYFVRTAAFDGQPDGFTAFVAEGSVAVT
jgi:hypothetical protein